jgi:phosphoglycolate phosphatase
MLRPLIIFDLDGTLWDSEPGIAAADMAAFETLGLHVPGGAPYIATALRGQRSQTKFNAVLDFNAGADPGLYKRYRTERTARVEADIVAGRYPLFDGVKETLDDLSRGATLALASNNPALRSRIGLKNCGVHHLIRPEFTFGPEQESDRKVNVVANALAKALVPRKNACMVGDSEEDMRAAGANGIAAIGFADRRRDDWEAHQAKLIAAGAQAIFYAYAPGLLKAQLQSVLPLRSAVPAYSR